jgi:lambda family phage portal protein
MPFDASSFGRLLKDWNPTSDGVNNTTLGSLVTMRNRCRDLARNNEWCVSAIDSLVATVTDPAIMPISKAPDEKFRKDVRQLWMDWGAQADAHGVLSWDLLVGLAYRSMVESGEVFIRLRQRRTSDGLVVPMQVQVIEADHVPVTKTETAANGNRIVAGVEFDSLGRRVAYHMYPEHPGESATQQGYNGTTTRVPAEQVIHLFDPVRPGQVRGYPRMAPVIVRMRNLAKYEDAELIKKLVSSLMVGVITSPTPDADLLGEEEFPEETGEEDLLASWTKMEPGTFSVLQPGEDVKFSNPPAGDSNYESHVKMNLRAAAAVWGLTYEQMTGDLTGVNFSSIRAGLNEFQRRARRSQRLLIHQLCRVVMERWLDEAVMTGAIVASDYVAQRANYHRFEWRPPGWRYVNPQQEIAAEKEMLQGGLASRQALLAERGIDINTVDEQIAEDYKRARELGLRFDTDPDGIDYTNVSMQEETTDAPPASGEEAPSSDDSGGTEELVRGRLQGLIERKVAKVVASQDEQLEAVLDTIMGE